MTDDGKKVVSSRTLTLEGETKWYRWLAWVFVAIGALVAVWGVFILWKQPDRFSLANLSSLGSFFQGSVAALWALAGLLFIYAAFVAQKRQLQLQEAELDDQAKQVARQNERIDRQIFENTFFQLLGLQNHIASEMRLTRKVNLAVQGEALQNVEGRQCFSTWYNHLIDVLNSPESEKTRPTSNDISKQREWAAQNYLIFYKSHQGVLGHYFRTLYHLFKFVKTHGPAAPGEQRRYSSLARAQLSAYELAILFYNGISPLGEQFKPLIEEFGLLENFEKNLLLHPDHVNFYDPRAYH